MDKIIEFNCPAKVELNKNTKVQIPLSLIIPKILPELRGEIKEWGFDQDYGAGKFLDYLKQKYGKPKQ